VAVAVTIERSNGGFGATVAAPIARDVMKTLLSEGQ
jgi:cell division protein FtsI/penicillin-binding protein 2